MLREERVEPLRFDDVASADALVQAYLADGVRKMRVTQITTQKGR